MYESKLWYLKKIDVFKGISDDEVLKIAKKVFEKKCQKKEILYTPFESTNCIYVLKKGEVTLYHLHNGKKLIIDVISEGSIFGNFNFQKENSSHFAEVTQSSYICIFHLEDFIKIIQSKPELMLKLLQLMSQRMNHYEERFKESIFDAKEKILNQLHLLRKSKKRNLLKKLMGREKKITHEKLSHYTGLTRETVTRVIQELKKEGKVHINPDGGLNLSEHQGDLVT